ncbi:hypothetical protein FH972_012766 [Carpinus fangiana]|uniref:SAC domain-containing protein n=1 Tax=Carpinus fangiana TaxID=176857 RepID=A0A5N6R4T5_9ROSI|nr:hypothetical protein FH972_012766 [Carpinus fangiana]
MEAQMAEQAAHYEERFRSLEGDRVGMSEPEVTTGRALQDAGSPAHIIPRSSADRTQGDLTRIGSSNENLNSLVNRDREIDFCQQNGKDNSGGEVPRFQSGVLRTNCIDCLDRTNVAQYAYGLAALGCQLHAMGLTDVPKVDPDSTMAASLMDMYQSMGDALAQQYGGSEAHNTVFTERQGKWKATTQSREFLKSIKRYYSNTYTDGEKQDAINLFLGYFQPREGKPAIWELDSDYYLHVSGIGDDLFLFNCPQSDAKLVAGVGVNLAPIPAWKGDFSRMKLTEFDKLIERTSSVIKDVRLYGEPDQRHGAGLGNSSVAPDAAEIQLKSPNWLFGQRKYEENGSAPKVTSQEIANGGSQDDRRVDSFCDLNWLSSASDIKEEDIFQRIHLGGIITEGNDSGFLEVKPAPYKVVLEDDTYEGLIQIGFKFIANVRMYIYIHIIYK